MSRRTLIALVVGFLIVVPLGLGALAVVLGGDDSRVVGAAVGAARADEYERSYGLHLYRVAPGGGQFLGSVTELTGCGKEAAVVLAPDATGVTRKQLSPASLTPCVLRLRAGKLRDPFYSMLNEILTGVTGRTGFWLVRLDRNGAALSGINIQDALLDVTFSKLDGDELNTLLEAVVTLRPTAVVEHPTCCGGFVPSGPTGTSALNIFTNGFDATISGVAGGQDIIAISGLKFSQHAAGTNVSVELGDLAITAVRHPTAGFRQWYAAGGEKTMTLVLKGGTTPRFSFTFTGVGMRSWEPVNLGSEGNAGAVVQDRFGLYVEEAALTLGAAPQPAPAPPPPPAGQTTTTPTPPPTPAPTTTSATPTVPVEPLGTPTGVTAEVVEAGTVALAWDAVKGAERYTILSSSRPGGPYALLAETRATDHTITKVESGTTLYVVIRAARGDEQSDDSEELQVPIK